MRSSVKEFFEGLETWRAELEKLREYAIAYPLTEQIKWGEPCYTLNGKNVLILSRFKEYCALSFFKGALMSDPQQLLIAPGQTQAGRQLRFTSLSQIVKMKAIVKAYIADAIDVEQKGLQVELKKHSDYEVPVELQQELDASARLKRAFEKLTPGRQRNYLFHIAAAKRAETRELRVNQCIPRIMEGKGLND